MVPRSKWLVGSSRSSRSGSCSITGKGYVQLRIERAGMLCRVMMGVSGSAWSRRARASFPLQRSASTQWPCHDDANRLQSVQTRVRARPPPCKTLPAAGSCPGTCASASRQSRRPPAGRCPRAQSPAQASCGRSACRSCPHPGPRPAGLGKELLQIVCLVIYDASSGIMISIRLSISFTSRSTAFVNWWKSVNNRFSNESKLLRTHMRNDS